MLRLRCAGEGQCVSLVACTFSWAGKSSKTSILCRYSQPEAAQRSGAQRYLRKMVSEPEQAHQHVITYIFALPGTVQCLHSAGYQRERMRYTQRDLPHFLRACTAHCCGFSTDITMLFLHVPMLLLRYFAPPLATSASENSPFLTPSCIRLHVSMRRDTLVYTHL